MINLLKKDKDSNLGTLLGLLEEDGINFALNGVVNIESGNISVRTERFSDFTQDYTGAFRECDNCAPLDEDRLFFSTCKTCGKSEDNYFWIPSGDGDGMYPLFTLLHFDVNSNEVKTFGFATILFPTEQAAQPIIDHALERAPNLSSPAEAFSFPPALLDPHSELEAFEITKFKGSKDGHIIYVSDAVTTIDSSDVILYFGLENNDDLTLLAFCENYESYPQGPKPRLIIGYSTNWLKEKGFKPSKQRPNSKAIYDDWTMLGITNCHLEPMGNVATWFNFKINEIFEKYNYAASWLLQGAVHGDPDCISEIERYDYLTSDFSWIVDWLEQRKQYQAAINFQDGRITLPFVRAKSDSQSNEGEVVAHDETLLKNINQKVVPFRIKCVILGKFWFEFKDDGDAKDFIEHNDVGLPLAWFISMGVVEPLEMANKFIDETFAMFLDAMEVTEENLVGVENLESFLEIVSKKKLERETGKA